MGIPSLLIIHPLDQVTSFLPLTNRTLVSGNLIMSKSYAAVRAGRSKFEAFGRNGISSPQERISRSDRSRPDAATRGLGRMHRERHRDLIAPISRPATGPAQAEFYYYKTDNLIRVENRERGVGGVVIRVLHDNFTEDAKHAFVRQLASEGFVPEGCEPVTWIVDDSWTFKLRPPRLISRFGRPVVATTMMILLMALITFFGIRVIDSTLGTPHPQRHEQNR